MGSSVSAVLLRCGRLLCSSHKLTVPEFQSQWKWGQRGHVGSEKPENLQGHPLENCNLSHFARMSVFLPQTTCPPAEELPSKLGWQGGSKAPFHAREGIC